MSFLESLGLDAASSALGAVFSNSQYEKQRDLINYQNWYNSPAQQVKRYNEAGLNPALMMQNAGGSASGNSSQSATPTNPPGSFGLASSAQYLQQKQMLDAQAEVLKSQARKNNADAGYTETDQRGLEQRNKAIYAGMLLENSIKGRQDEIENMNFNSLLQKPLVELERMVAERDTAIIERKLKAFGFEHVDETFKADLGLKLAQAMAAIASAGLSKAQANYLINQNKEFVAMLNEKNKQGYFAHLVKYMMLKATKDGSPSSFGEAIGMDTDMTWNEKFWSLAGLEVSDNVTDVLNLVLSVRGKNKLPPTKTTYTSTAKGTKGEKNTKKVETYSIH